MTPEEQIQHNMTSRLHVLQLDPDNPRNSYMMATAATEVNGHTFIVRSIRGLSDINPPTREDLERYAYEFAMHTLSQGDSHEGA